MIEVGSFCYHKNGLNIKMFLTLFSFIINIDLCTHLVQTFWDCLNANRKSTKKRPFANWFDIRVLALIHRLTYALWLIVNDSQLETLIATWEHRILIVIFSWKMGDRQFPSNVTNNKTLLISVLFNNIFSGQNLLGASC